MNDISVRLVLDDGSFHTGVVRAGEDLRRLQGNVNGTVVSLERMGQSSRSFLSTLRDVTTVVGLAGAAVHNLRAVTTGWAGDIIKVNAELERMTTLMKGMSNAADPLKDAVQQVKFLRDYATQAPFSLQALSDVFVRMKATGIDPTKGAMRGLVDAVAAFGGSEDVLKRAALAISQMSGKGVIQMEELRQQLGEAVPRATELMARSMGVSYGTLVKAIESGTVSAKESLELLQLEFQRTFGGAALAQMQTWNGMMAQARTQVQNFAISIGNAGFFDAVKAQLRDFNAALSGPTAARFAENIGQGLTTIVNGLRRALDFVIEFKDEILRVGQVMASVWAANAVIGGTGRMLSSVAALRTQYVLLREQITLLGRAQAAATTTAGLSSFAGALGQVGIVAAGVAATFSAIAPVAVALGSAVLVVADYLGLFSNKAKDAYENLEKFGAASAKEIEAAKGYVEAEKANLRTLESEVARYQARRAKLVRDAGGNQNAFSVRGWDIQYGAELKRMQQQLTTARESMQKMQDTISARTREFDAREAQEGVKRQMDAIAEQLQVIQRGYDQEAIAASKAHEENRKRLAAANKVTDGENKRYAQEQRSIQLKRYENEIQLLEKHLKDMQDSMAFGNEEQARVAQATADKINEQLRTVYENRQRLESLPEGIPTLSKSIDGERLLEKGRRQLERLKEDVVNYRAEVSGASGETAKLLYQMSQAKFGDAASEEVQQLVKDLIDAQEAKEKLDELMRGRKNLQRDLQNAAIKREEERFEAEYGHLSEIEKIRIRIQQGKYTGITLDTSEDVLSETRQGIIATGQAADAVDKLIKNGIFGSETFSSGNKFVSLIESMRTAWAGFRSQVEGTNVAGAFAGVPEGAGPGAGASMTVSGNFIDKVVGVESGGNPYAKNSRSSATGLGQFIKSTWLQFLQEMHPGLIEKKGVMSALALRTDPTMSRQAVSWYAGKNAAELQKSGYQANDANLYLAHFLGSGGAKSILGANGAMPAGMVLDKDTMKANPFLNGMSARDVIAWAQKKMGMGSSFGGASSETGQPQNARTVEDRLKDDAEDEKRTKQLVEQKRIKDELQKLDERAIESQSQINGMGKEEAELRKKIALGKLGSEKNPDAEMYKDLIAKAKELDKAETTRAEKRKLERSKDRATQSMEQRAEDVANKAAESMRRLNDPNGYKMSDGEAALDKQLRREVDAIRAFYGEGTEEVRKAEERRAQIIQQYRDADVREKAASLAAGNDELRRSLMTEGEARQAALDEEIARYQKLLETVSANAEGRAEIEAAIQERISLLRQQAQKDGPLAKQMKEWSDLGKNLEQSMTGWIDSAIDGLATFITTGKADFASLAQSIMKDISKIALQKVFAGASGKGGNTASSKTGKLGGSKTAGVKHAGGIVGALGGPSRNVSALAFHGAPRFHTGGIVGGIRPGEVPIIAKKGEGVFTPEQMAMLGGSMHNQAVTMNNNITVNATGGTPEQNNDLAKQIGAQVEGITRQIVAKEMRAQMRPGGVLKQR